MFNINCNLYSPDGKYLGQVTLSAVDEITKTKNSSGIDTPESLIIEKMIDRHNSECQRKSRWVTHDLLTNPNLNRDANVIQLVKDDFRQAFSLSEHWTVSWWQTSVSKKERYRRLDRAMYRLKLISDQNCRTALLLRKTIQWYSKYN